MENNPTWMCVVALALQDENGRWLLHKRPAHKHHGGLWEFPGGKVEPAEKPASALVREIGEELGIAIREADLAPCCFAEEAQAEGRAPIVILLYTCSRWTGEVAALEGGEVAWFAPGAIAGLDKPPLDIVLAARLLEKMPD
ncbi:(deoxy)nucleoside triphosphate pyrophosphohydrolase [Qipengyuania gaetbuli]|uniref:(deoxy)nucleoside triphosphate pyrophosphohydrolase n=1 Tax=Qipengyuania gaetbuli TaxID=266952 RepID=UPI00299E6AC8|nr:(deoxy)nucleoside triphosphate pyrophosphohydrolase [Qipengyuania gaetbuli]